MISILFRSSQNFQAPEELQLPATTITGPNDARCVVWALDMFFSYRVTCSCCKCAANDGQQRPTQAHEGPQQLTTANKGQRRPRKARSSQRRPTKAHKDEKGPMTWTGEMGRVMAGARGARPRGG